MKVPEHPEFIQNETV